jgi:ribosome-binding protein aMBF1 (putative translation factor)
VANENASADSGVGLMNIFECDVCGRKCSRIHHCVTCGTDTAACDDCAGYEWDAYGEDPDPLLVPDDSREREDEERRRYFDNHDRSEP